MVDNTKEKAAKAEEEKLDIEIEGEDKPEIEITDDTPEEDKGRKPMPKEIVAEIEADELEEYTGRVKARMVQLKKIWHDSLS